MNVTERIQRSLSNRRGDVFVRADFQSFGSPAQVGRALGALTARGSLVKLGVGVYAKAKASVLSGLPIPVKPVEVLAPLALQRLGVVLNAARVTSAYNAGRSTQLPAGIVLNTGKRRISRKLGFNGTLVQYERA
jgi:Family of unknown function (DUF6088)